MRTKTLAILLVVLTVSPQRKARALVHVESLEYPGQAWAAQIQGEVVAIALIGAGGEVRGTAILSGHPLLGEAAVHDLGAWKFEAGEQEEIHVTYKFVLTEPKARARQTICKFDFPDTVTVISNMPLPDY